jgi:two-component system cell cycle response regulator PopA
LARQALTLGPPPLATLIGLDSARPPSAGLAPLAAFDGAVCLDARPELLGRQVRQAIRLGVLEAEALRRCETAATFGVEAPPALPRRKLKALYVGAPAPFFLALERAFSAQGGLVTAAFTSFTGFDHLHDEAFDAVALNAASDAHTAISLCAALRRNANFASMPTLVVTAAGDAQTAHVAIQRGAAVVASQAGDVNAALGWLFDAIRRERRRRTAEHEAAALRDLMGEARTGLFRADAFAAHADRLAHAHHATGQPLTLAAIRVLPAHGARRPNEATWRKTFHEIASLSGRLIRESDCGAAHGDDVIVIALPFTDLASGRRTAERIASVAECTTFATDGADSAPLTFEQSVVELQPGESAAGLIARALAVFDARSARA